MSRLYGMLAVADGAAAQVLSAVPAMALVRRPEHTHHHLLVERVGEELDLILLPLAQGATLPQQSRAPSRLWDLYMAVADSRDVLEGEWRWLAAVWRALLRRQQADPGWLLGPFSPAQVAEQWPELTSRTLKGARDEQGELQPGSEWSFPLLAGDRHEAVVAVDYRPSQQAIDGDTDPDPEELFPQPRPPS